MSGRFDGRVVVVTGAAQGQGAVQAQRFLDEGATVVAADVAIPATLAAGMEHPHLDVSDPTSWAALVADVADRWGRLDVLVNNAGISRGTDVRGTSLEDWNAVLSVDLTGAFLGIQACASLLRDSGGGAIVNTGSAIAYGGFYRAAYAAAKWGLRGLSQSAALELAPWGITVNTIHPGLVDSPMATESPLYDAILATVPIGRPTGPDEIANLVLFLASSEARTLTGGDYLIDGGLTAAGPMNHVARTMGLWGSHATGPG
ncbi:MAG: 3alpha(or 20beta)-hydroxysteroid dehydrogenase [Actinomycetia bacterium]|nr:3alpha(or 20beta)-hydroxysteroid dehydrogenase [Actinomycetes bacterium]